IIHNPLGEFRRKSTIFSENIFLALAFTTERCDEPSRVWRRANEVADRKRREPHRLSLGWSEGIVERATARRGESTSGIRRVGWKPRAGRRERRRSRQGSSRGRRWG